MNGNEFLRRLKKLAKAKGLKVSLVSRIGKGSHISVYLGKSRTTLKDRTKEIDPGLLAAMLKQLGVSKEDF